MPTKVTVEVLDREGAGCGRWPRSRLSRVERLITLKYGRGEASSDFGKSVHFGISPPAAWRR
jgi:hypothetical protein